MSTPQSNIYICSGVRLDNRQQHTIHFKTVTEQREFFAGKVVKTFSAYSYHRRKWKLKVDATMAQAMTWNYLYIVQPGTPQYQYYFINSVDYLNDSTVELDLELDVMQTYLGQYMVLPCFVERTHVSNDAVGANTVPEGLEMGPYFNYYQTDLTGFNQMGVLVLSAVNLADVWEKAEDVKMSPAMNYSGVYSGLSVYAFSNTEALTNKLRQLDKYGKIDAIVSIWMYPRAFITLKDGQSGEAVTWADLDANKTTFQTALVSGVINDANSLSVTLATYNNYDEKLFEGYTPKNNKLYTYPYNLLYCTNNAGETANYRFEYFNTARPQFAMYSAVGPDATVKMCPDQYNMATAHVNYDEGISLGNFPQCAFNSDSYKVWLAQNYNQLKHSSDTAMTSALIGAGTAIAGLATGNMVMAGGGAMAVLGGVNQVNSIMAQKEDAKAQPPQAKGTFSTAVNMTAGRQTFSIYYKCIRKEYAQQLDDFFTMYGYRVNRVMTPNTRVRKGFTFIKTAGCKISGGMPNEDVTHIQNIFDNGITFWTDGDLVGNYNIDNSL